MTKLTRGRVIRDVDKAFPNLKDLVESVVAVEGNKNIPRPIQLKSKKMDMLQSIVSGSTQIFYSGLGLCVSKALEALGETKVEQLYHGFITHNDVDRQKLFDNEASCYVVFQDGKLPLMEAVLLFLILTALKDDPMQVCTRVTLTQVRKWLSDYQIAMAHRLHYVMYKTISKKTQVDITVGSS